MLVLGLQGSPRKKGNSDYLLTQFLQACEQKGARTRVIRTDGLKIAPCRELIVCEKKGFCPIKDEMEPHIYGLIRRADVVVLASPVFFYNVSAQAKILIDRCQMFWGRKYKLKLADPDAGCRQGVLLSAAASGGKRLFEGVELTAKYFFDAISAEFAESLTYKKVESAGAVAQVPGVDTDIQKAAARVMAAVQNKPALVFISAKNACRTQMAAAFAKQAAKGDTRVLCAGIQPAEDIDPLALHFMAQQGIDIKYRLPEALDTLMVDEFTTNKPACVVCLEPDITPIPGVKTVYWDLPEAADAEGAALVGKQIQARVEDLVSGLKQDMAANR